MAHNYNQLRAMMAVAKGSFKAILRNPSAVAFSFGFPLVFILVFGFIGGGAPSVSIALANPRDSSASVIKGLVGTGLVRLSAHQDSTTVHNDLVRGRIAAVVYVDSALSPANF